jgi:hypothetical protein
MEEIIICILLYMLIAYFGIVPLIKKKEKKLLYIYVACFVVTLSVFVLNGLDFAVPSPAQLIKTVIYKIIHTNNGTNL